MPMSSRIPTLAALALLTGAAAAGAGSERGAGRRADQEALKPYAGLVGEWRGTGQERRGSARGAWTESAAWAWDLDADSAALVVSLTDGRHLRSARLRPAGPGSGRAFVLEATLADGRRRTFRGRPDDRGRLALVADGEDGDTPPDGPARVTLTPLHEARFLMLLEAAEGDGGGYRRLGEVGYTRRGAAFAVGDSYPECVVTGGRGTIRVEYRGQAYYVCCSGCKDLFEDDPAGILAEAAERAKADGE